MPQEVTVGYKKYTFADGVTEEQIIAFVEQDQASAPQQDISAAQQDISTPVAPPVAPQPQPQDSTMIQGNYDDVPVLDDQLGFNPQVSEAPQYSIPEKLIGVGETALTVGTGATTGAIGFVGGFGKELVQQILDGNFGTTEAADLIERAALLGMQEGTYIPRTPAGQDYAQNVGQVAAQLPPVIGVGPMEAPAIVQGARNVVPGTRQALQSTADATRRVVGERGTGQGIMGQLPAVGEVVDPARSVGAAQTPAAMQRRTVAEGMPVPFEGDTALTAGQASRDPGQLRFEGEMARQEVGAPIVARIENQTARFIDNFDALIDVNQPIAREVREVGAAVDSALVTKAEVMRKQIQEAYKVAREAGELEAPVDTSRLADTLNQLDPQKGLTPIITAVEKEALRIGALQQTPDGLIVGAQTPLNNTEILRKFVNQSTDWTNPNEGRIARIINESIDTATQGAGGERYQAARQLRTKYANEFENTGLIAKLLGTKGRTSERAIAVENVFDKVILRSSIEEINKLRSTLLKGGTQGKQAWADLKAQLVRYIQEKATTPSGTDSRGTRTLSSPGLQKVIRQLDEQGKLTSIFGKKNAQVFRDLADLSAQMKTVPANVANPGTGGAIFGMMNWLASGATGQPLPGGNIIRELLKFTENRELKLRIKEALKDPNK